jgi:acyl carrier protein
MNSPYSASSGVAALEHQLVEFIRDEMMAADGAEPIAAEDDLIKQGIVDSLGITQLVEFCESRYGIRVTDAELVPQNFQSVRRLAEYVDGKRVEQGGGLPFPTRSG